MIETEAVICVYKYKAELKLSDFIYLFTYLFSLARGEKYSPLRIQQEVFNDLHYFHKLETF